MAKTSLRKPLGVLANGVDGQVVLSWESVQGADGYEVFDVMLDVSYPGGGLLV